MSKVTYEVKDAALNVGLDLNEDGEKSVDLKVHLGEALEEAFKKGTAVEGVKVVDFKFELTKLKITLDTDQDGEKLVELSIDLAEAFDEGTTAFKKEQTPAAE